MATGIEKTLHDLGSGSFARGYHEWFVNEIEEGRVLWPKLGIPASTKKS